MKTRFLAATVLAFMLSAGVPVESVRAQGPGVSGGKSALTAVPAQGLSVAGRKSMAERRDPQNEVIQLNIGAGNQLIGLTFDVGIDAIAPTQILHVGVRFGNTMDHSRSVAPGTSTLSGFREISEQFDLELTGNTVTVAADGLLAMEFYAAHDHHANAPEALWFDHSSPAVVPGIGLICSDQAACDAAVAAYGAVSDLVLSPAHLDLGTAVVGTALNGVLTITNNGATPASVAVPAFTGAFERNGGNCPSASFPLAAGASCEFGISLTASTAGSHAGSVSINAGGTTLTSTLAATLNAAPAPSARIVFATSSLDLGAVVEGASLSGVITLRNDGDATGQIVMYALTGQFEVIGGTCGSTPFDVAAGQACTFEIGLTATAAGNHVGSIEVNAGGDPVRAALSARVLGVNAPASVVHVPAGNLWTLMALVLGMALGAAVLGRHTR